MLDRLCDILTFGALEPCAECNGGQLVYQSGITSDLEKGPFLVPISKLLQVSVIDVRATYLNGPNARLSWIANSSYSEWNFQQVKSLNPGRREFKVPNDFKQEFDFLAMYKVISCTEKCPNEEKIKSEILRAKLALE